MWNCIADDYKATIAAHQAEVDGFWAFRWVDSDCCDWEPVDGEHQTEESARKAVRMAYKCSDEDFICEPLEV